MLNELLFRRSPWVDRLARIAQTAGDLLKEHGVYCLVGAFRVDDGRANRLLIELRGDLRDLDPVFVTSLKALLVHGLNKKMDLGLQASSVVLAIGGEDTSFLPSLKAASLNVLGRLQAASDAPKPGATRHISVQAPDGHDTQVEVTEFSDSHWTRFQATVQIPRAASSRFGEL